MKKRIFIFIVLTALIELGFVSVCMAGTGEKIGKVYSTDIVAYMDGIPINSYNIGGRTGIICEELKEYGFYVSWDSNTRKLFITSAGEKDGMKGLPELKGSKDIGKVIGSIYKTDIKAYVNGKGIPSYNIGGRTIVLIEDLNEGYGFTTHWDAEKRTISATPYRSGSIIHTDLGVCKISELGSASDDEHLFDVYACSLELDGKTVTLQNNMLQINGQEYLPLRETLDSIETDYLWDNEANKLIINYPPDKITLRNGSEIINRINPYKTDDTIYKINMTVEIAGVEFPIMGSIKGIMRPQRTDEMPVVYKRTMYFPAEALADYFNLIYKGKGSFITKNDDPYTWAHDAKNIYMPIGQTDSELYKWIEYIVPENHDSGRNLPLIYSYKRNEPVKIKFVRPMDAASLSKINIPVVLEYYSQRDNTFQYEVISDKYDYFYDEKANELLILLSGADSNLPKDELIVIFIKNIIDSEGNKLESLYQFKFLTE